MEPFEELEQKFAAWANVQNPVACASGTAALHLALASADLPRGSEVIMPEFTMIACARAVSAAGLRPVFVDCTDDLLMDVDQLPDCLTDTTSALMAVHIYGRRCPMDKIHAWCREAAVDFVIEDMAEIHGVAPHRRTNASCWSFYRNKIIHGEEGGLVSFASLSLANKAKDLRTLGQHVRHDFIHAPGCWNHRLSNAHARLILDSLIVYDYNQDRRRKVERWYDEHLPVELGRMPKRDAVWVYDLRLRGRDATQIVPKLNAQGIAARMAFKPMSEQQEYRGHFRHLNAYRLSREVMYLPVYPDMTEADVERNVKALKTYL